MTRSDLLKLIVVKATRVVVVISIFCTCLHSPLFSQEIENISGTWQGTLSSDVSDRLVLKFNKDDGSTWRGLLFHANSYIPGMNIQNIRIKGTTLVFTVEGMSARFEGAIRKNKIDGSLVIHGQSHNLQLERATKDTEWIIPQSSAVMVEDAKPEYNVVTIKLSKPGSGDTVIAGVNGRHIIMGNVTIREVIAFAYGLDKKQVIGKAAELDDIRYDIDGIADIEGRPTVNQLRLIFQDLLMKRFMLISHKEKKELSVYALTVAKGGPKLSLSASAPNDPTPFYSSVGELKVTNQTMAIFSDVLHFFVDKPVVDQTNLSGRYDLVLRWTPDDAKNSDPSAPPEFFTAFREQLGLKLEAVKMPTDVFVVEQVQKPSAN